MLRTAGPFTISYGRVLRAIEWGIHAWEAIEPQTMINCWQKGFHIEGPAQNSNLWSDSLDLIQDIQDIAKTIAHNQGIQDPLGIRNFIYPEDERVIDLEEDITNQIVEHYSLPEKEQDYGGTLYSFFSHFL